MSNARRVRMALLVVAAAVATLGACASSFDKPIRTTVVNLGRSAYLMAKSPERIQLTCIYYSSYFVKQLDDPGLKGTQWVTITHVVDGRFPICKASHSSTERFLAKDGWFFMGIKGPLYFLEAPDGENGAMSVRVVDSKTGKNVFEDSVLFWNSGRLPHMLEFTPSSDATVLVRYRRSVQAKCSIPKDGARCWGEIRRRFGLAVAPVPKCVGYRQEGQKDWVVGDEGVPPDEITAPSVIAYPVEVNLSAGREIKVIRGSIWCSAPD